MSAGKDDKGWQAVGIFAAGTIYGLAREIIHHGAVVIDPRAIFNNHPVHRSVAGSVGSFIYHTASSVAPNKVAAASGWAVKNAATAIAFSKGTAIATGGALAVAAPYIAIVGASIGFGCIAAYTVTKAVSNLSNDDLI